MFVKGIVYTSNAVSTSDMHDDTTVRRNVNAVFDILITLLYE